MIMEIVDVLVYEENYNIIAGAERGMRKRKQTTYNVFAPQDPTVLKA